MLHSLWMGIDDSLRDANWRDMWDMKEAVRRSAARQLLHYFCQFVEVVRWCMELGVQYITVYAFSIENFNRSEIEVEELMQLARQEYKRFKEHGLVHGYEADVRVVGDLARTGTALQSAAARLMLRPHRSEASVVHICFSYTYVSSLKATIVGRSSQEMCRAVDIGRRLGLEMTEDRLERLCFTGDCPEVDVMIRTSGETRLSDFMNLQCRRALLIFDKVMWPDYSLWDFASALMRYQQHYQSLKDLKQLRSEEDGSEHDVDQDHRHSNGSTGTKTLPEDEFEISHESLSQWGQTHDRHLFNGEAVQRNGSKQCLDGDADFSSLLTALSDQKRSWINKYARLP